MQTDVSTEDLTLLLQTIHRKHKIIEKITYLPEGILITLAPGWADRERGFHAILGGSVLRLLEEFSRVGPCRCAMCQFRLEQKEKENE